MKIIFYGMFSMILFCSNYIRGQNCEWEKVFISEPNYCSENSKLKLVFEDNFDGNTLDTNKWQNYFPWGRYLINNSGSSYHTDGDNIIVNNGKLIFTAKEESITANIIDYRESGCTTPDIGDCILEDGKPNRRTFKYTDGMIYSKQKFGAGLFEIRCKIPPIDGVWPAFWLYGWSGQEIDVFEFWNDRINQNTSVSSREFGMALHKVSDPNSKKPCTKRGHFKSATDFSKDFHTFSVEWSSYKITWRLDSIIIQTIFGLKDDLGQDIYECGSLSASIYYRNPIMPTFPMNIIAGLGVKDFCQPDGCNRGAFPVQMEVDYIKFWERSTNKATINTYPNPTKRFISISSSDTINKINNIIVTTLLGNIIIVEKNLQLVSMNIDLSDYPKGMYFIITSLEEKQFVNKVVLL